ncbi:uncharacterized protein BDZ99DRAFT_527634 [Mytilinidion resinicola]|uniref:SGNH hydrolase n=1 Tax=Mytilinidion resinicola TaxID=574789 RepID=A0A6A6Y2M9_9PEZI|nr:uncharacterized protein BDZ99DRAFT_527634 [Mytilinidion resinicola]KAF2802264.1 hypothetical protein BDZ99DRAFT_527634 [Mytilinidion resinicola]
MRAFLLLSVGTTILAPIIHSTPIAPFISPDPKIHWASLGDSWATGVTWFKDIDYDEDYDELICCRRLKEAYAYQLSQNNDFFHVGKQVFKWPACSGLNFGDMEGQARRWLMCDEESFGTLWRRPKLTSRLRHDINDLAELLKQKIMEGVQRFKDTDHNGNSVYFVEISKSFDGHRFSENDHNITDQWDSIPTRDRTWIYLPPRPPWNDPWVVPAKRRKPVQQDIDDWVKQYPDSSIGTDGSGSNPDRPGIIMKTFHPKTLGFGSMADNIQKVVKDRL